MIGETFFLMRSKGVDKKCAGEPAEQISMVPKLVIFLASVAITGATAIAVAAPLALLHVR